MIIKVEYMAQLKYAAGVTVESFEIQQGNFSKLLEQILKKHESLREYLVGAGNNLLPTIIAIVNNDQVIEMESMSLHDGDEVVFLSPVSGG